MEIFRNNFQFQSSSNLFCVFKWTHELVYIWNPRQNMITFTMWRCDNFVLLIFIVLSNLPFISKRELIHLKFVEVYHSKLPPIRDDCMYEHTHFCLDMRLKKKNRSRLVSGGSNRCYFRWKMLFHEISRVQKNNKSLFRAVQSQS